MASTKLHQVSDGASHQSRREALKRFGRYAAIAPTAMILLQSRESLAHGGWRRGWGRGGRKHHGFNHHY
jgi:hypothetical protein